MVSSNRLSKREKEVAALLLQGKSNKQIALALGISESTVEFHLKNVYAKLKVNSRVEAILELGNSTGLIGEDLRKSVVDDVDRSMDNSRKFIVWKRWTWLIHDTVSTINKEIAMKNLLSTKHALIGGITGLCVGLLWIATLMYFEIMPLDEIKTWSLPFIFSSVIIGGSVGLVGKRNGKTLQKVFFSALCSTGLSPFLVIPLMLILVLPLGKLAERLGFIDPATMPGEVATTLTAITMLTIWLSVGLIIGIALLFVTIAKPARMDNHGHGIENGSSVSNL